MVALMLAAQHREIVKTVILGDVPLSKTILVELVKAQAELIRQVVQLIKSNDTEQIYQAIKDSFAAESFSCCDPDIFQSMLDQLDWVLDGYEVLDLAQKIACPVLIQRGTQSKGSLTTDHDIELFTKKLNVHYHIDTFDTGHDLYKEDRTNPQLGMVNFLNRNELL